MTLLTEKRIRSEDKEFLSRVVGPSLITDEVVDLIAYSSDSSEYQHFPDIVICVESTEQVATILKYANQKKIPVTPRGAGTGMSGLAVPVRGGILLDLMRMREIKSISIEDRIAVVQPGVIYADLEKALKPFGFFFPPDPASGKVSTLGGNVATNAGGMKGAKYSSTRDYVLGLEVVLADGAVLRTGSGTIKSVSGYDLTRIFVGSEGTLGVITEISLKINPKPKAKATCSAAFEAIGNAGDAVAEIMRSGVIPSVLEILDRQCLLCLNETLGMELPESAALLLAETDGFTQGECDYQMSKVIEAFKNNKAKVIRRATSEEEAEELWKGRRAIYGVVAGMKPNIIVEDITVPISKVTTMLNGIQELSKKYDVVIPVLGHIGDGNLHPYIVFDAELPGEKMKINELEIEFYELAIRLGGTLTGEHGIGISKAKFMPLEHTPIAMMVMRNIKTALDPNNILNPGKMGLEE